MEPERTSPDLSVHAVSFKSSRVHDARLNVKRHRRPEHGYICLAGFWKSPDYLFKNVVLKAERTCTLHTALSHLSLVVTRLTEHEVADGKGPPNR